MAKPMSGAAGEINRAAGEMPKREARSAANAGGVGNERKGDVRGTQEGGSAASAGGTRSSLREATAHLRNEHPIAHDDRGPHHGGTDHVRHAPHVVGNKSHPYG